MSENNEDSRSEEHAANTGPAASQEAVSEEIEKRFYRLEFDARKSIRYHTKRKRFFDNWHYFLVAVSALSSSGAFTSLISSDTVTLPAKILTGIVAVASAIDLAIGFSKRSHLYDSLQRRFSDLLIKITQNAHTEKNIKTLESERLAIEKNEPPTLTALDIFCRNEELRAQGRDEHLRKFDSRHKFFMHYFSFDGWVPAPLETQNGGERKKIKLTFPGMSHEGVMNMIEQHAKDCGGEFIRYTATTTNVD